MIINHLYLSIDRNKFQYWYVWESAILWLLCNELNFALEVVRAHEGVKYFLEDCFNAPSFLRNIYEYRIHQFLYQFFPHIFLSFKSWKRKPLIFVKNTRRLGIRDSWKHLVNSLVIRYRTLLPYKPHPMPILFFHSLMSRVQNFDLF